MSGPKKIDRPKAAPPPPQIVPVSAAVVADGTRPAEAASVAVPAAPNASLVRRPGALWRPQHPAEGYSSEFQIAMIPLLGLFTSANPLDVMRALVGILNLNKLDRLRSIYTTSYGSIYESMPLLISVRAILDSETAPVFLKVAALPVLVAADPDASGRVMKILRDNSVSEFLREAALAVWGRVDTVPREVEDILRRTARDETFYFTTRVAAIGGLSHLPYLQDLVRLAMTDKIEEVQDAAHDAVRGLITRFGNDGVEAQAAFEVVQGHFFRSNGNPNSYALGFSTIWGEKAVPVLADLSANLHNESPDVLWTLMPLRDNREAAAAVARLLAHPNPEVREFVAKHVFEIWDVDAAVAAVGMLDHPDDGARQVAVEWVRKAGLPRVDFDADTGMSPSRRAEFVERLIDELRLATAPMRAPGPIRPPRIKPKEPYRLATYQLTEAFRLVGLDAWDVLVRTHDTTATDDPVRPHLEAALKIIADQRIPDARTRFVDGNQRSYGEAARELSKMGTYSIPVLMDIFTTGDPIVATRAGHALAEMGIPGYEAIAELGHRESLSPEVIERQKRFLELAGTELARALASSEDYRRPDRRFGSPFDLSLEGPRRGR